MRRPSSTGFTIVELFIVTVVIAILASVSVVAFNGIRDRSVNSAVISDARKLKNLLDQYIVINGYESLSAVLPANTWYCLGGGENYTDLDPGSATSCYEYNLNYGYNLSSALDAAMRSMGNCSISSASVVKGMVAVGRKVPSRQK